MLLCERFGACPVPVFFFVIGFDPSSSGLSEPEALINKKCVKKCKGVYGLVVLPMAFRPASSLTSPWFRARVGRGTQTKP